MVNTHVTLVVDSGCDMLPQEADALGIRLLPITVSFGDEEYLDGVTLTREAFYSRISQPGTFPKTSCITPYQYEECFREAVNAGNDVVCLTLSSKLSGCYQNAINAAKAVGGNIFVVDTLQVCGTEYLLAERAAYFRDVGMSARDIAAAIENEKSQPKLIALLDTLEYLRKGGRISAASAAIGGILSIKPVVTIEDGQVKLIGKARGSKNGRNLLTEYVDKHHGIDFSRPYLLSAVGDSSTLLEQYVHDSAHLYPDIDPADLKRSCVGPTIGTYIGPGAIALSFYPKQSDL